MAIYVQAFTDSQRKCNAIILGSFSNTLGVFILFSLFVVEDFNEKFRLSEKQGGSDRIYRDLDRFCEAVDSCGLIN